MLAITQVSVLRQSSIKFSTLLKGFNSFQQLAKFNQSYSSQHVFSFSKYKPHSILSSIHSSKNVINIVQLRFYCVPTTSSTPPPAGIKADEKQTVVRRVDPTHLTANRKKPKERNLREPYITEHMLEEAAMRPDGQILSFQEKVQENTKTTGYTAVIALGFCLIAAVFTTLWMDLFSSNSPNQIYSKSFKLVQENQDVVDLLGAPIKAFGEETRRGYRRHVAHQIFFNNHIRHIRMKFYVQGKFGKGTVHLEMLSNDHHGDFEKYSFLVVDIEHPQIRIVIEPKEEDLVKEDEEEDILEEVDNLTLGKKVNIMKDVSTRRG